MLRRETLREKRAVRDALGARNAAEAVGQITAGCEMYGLFAGQFSLISIIEHLLSQTGPAEVVVGTWTAGAGEINSAYRLLRDGRVQSLKFVIDFSFQSRQPSYCKALRERFGDECIRVTKNHAKFVLILNDTWKLVLRTSANLNENRRLENFEISDDPAMAAYILRVVDELFAAETGAETFAKRPGEHVRAFDRMTADAAGKPEPPTVEKPKPGPFDVDVFRGGGLTYL